MIALITAAINSNNNEAIAKAEAALFQYRTQDIEGFLKEAAGILQDQANQTFIRQSAGTLLRKSINEKCNTGVIWDFVNQGLKTTIKNSLLTTLISTDKLAKRAAADAISVICGIELPRKQWPDIIFNLVNNTKHENLEYRSAAIMTLGFICEQLRDKSQSTLQTTQLQSILTGILLGVKENTGQIRETSIKALRDIMGFLAELLKNAQYRNYTFACVLEVLNSDLSVRIVTLQVVIEFVKVNYEYLESYIIAIFNIIAPIIKDNKRTAESKLAMEVWDTIATEYNELSQRFPDRKDIKNYITGEMCTKLVETILQNFLVFEEQEDDEENSIRECGFRTLSSIGLVSGNEIVNIILTFVSKTISHENWKYRQASLKAFCTLLEGVQHDKIKTMISNALVEFLKLLEDPNIQVQINTAFSLSKISQTFSECFFTHPNFADMIKLLLASLPKNPSISKHIVFVFYHFGTENKQNPNRVINDQLDHITSALLSNCYRQDFQQAHYSLISHSFMAVMELFNCCQQPKVLIKYLEIIILEFEKSYNFSAKKRSFIQCGMLTIIQSCLINLNGTPLPQAGLTAIYNLIINYFKKTGDVSADAMYVLAALSIYFPNSTSLLDNVWPYIEHSLSKINDAELFKSTLGCIGDFARSLGQRFKPRLIVMKSLIQALQLPQFDRMLKIAIISCIGDIFLACKQDTKIYYEQVMNVYLVAYESAILMTDTDFEYSEVLKQNLIESTLCSMHGLNNQEVQQQVCRQYIPHIFNFVKLSCEKKYRPTVEYVRNCLMLLCDISNFFPKDTAVLMRSQSVMEMIQIMKQHNKQGENQSVIEFAKHILSRM